MTLASVLAAFLGTIDLNQLTDDAKLLTSGLTEEEAVVIVTHLIDTAIPEELFGAAAEAIAEPLYAEAATRIVTLITRRVGHKGAKPHHVQRLMQNERARVDALLAAGGGA